MMSSPVQGTYQQTLFDLIRTSSSPSQDAAPRQPSPGLLPTTGEIGGPWSWSFEETMDRENAWSFMHAGPSSSPLQPNSDPILTQQSPDMSTPSLELSENTSLTSNSPSCGSQHALCLFPAPMAQQDGSNSATENDKKKVQRRQGVTCDQCRSKHIRCINGRQTSNDQERQCERCREKGLECTRNYAPPSRRYPRPSRTGKRIEQARMIHGSLGTNQQSLSPQMLPHARPALLSSALSTRVMEGSVSLRLLTCFFATAHMQMPIVDFHNFSARYNYSQGDCRIMAIMANGGDEASGIPSAKQSAPGLLHSVWPPDTGKTSTLATPGTSEALIAVMHAWAALYTDMPLAFGSTNELHQEEAVRAAPPAHEYVMGTNGKLRRPKRKQGVACDTCRLRRLRCDKLERPAGLGCTRCQDKRIVCTDEYIQSKRKKMESRSRSRDDDDERDDHGMIGSAPMLARDVATHGDSSEQQSWLQQGRRLPTGSERHSLLAYGKARQPFFHARLQRALGLVMKHRLLEEPSVEGIQTLTLLGQVVDLASNRAGEIFVEAATNHITALGLQSNHEVDESDRKAVEQILGDMQRRRLWCCVWTRDAIISGLYRKTPTFEAERALGIKTTVRADASQQQQQQSQQMKGRSRGSAELNGEMGLSFSILALMQVGSLSRFMAQHIDNVASSVEAGAPRLPSEGRTSAMPSAAEVRKVTKACHALWKSIDSLLLFFDQCSLKARKNMDNLQPFQPLGWIATIKIAGAMLELGVFRILAERVQRASEVMTTAQDNIFVHSIHELLNRSRDRALTICRRIAKLVEFLLTKNVFQTGGLIMRQLLSVTYFLAKMPTEHLISSASAPGAEAFSSAAASSDAIDPRALFASTTAAADSNSTAAYFASTSSSLSSTPLSLSSPTSNPTGEESHVPESIFTSQLGAFDAPRKQKEVETCLEALAQLGYAWPTMDTEIANIEGILRESL